MDADRKGRGHCDPSYSGQVEGEQLPARVAGCMVDLLGERGEAPSGEDGEVSLKHPEPEGEKARGWWPQGRGPGRPSRIWG